MDQSKPTIQWQTRAGKPVIAGEVRATPQSQALIVRWKNAGFVWNRPVAVVVERPGQIQRIPVFDITRIVQWGLLATSAACWIGFALLSKEQKKVARKEPGLQ